jgi:hypothetical protein
MIFRHRVPRFPPPAHEKVINAEGNFISRNFSTLSYLNLAAGGATRPFPAKFVVQPIWYPNLDPFWP